MKKELLDQLISFVEKSPNDAEKYKLLKQLYLIDNDEKGLNTSSVSIKRVHAIQTIDEIVRRISINDISFNQAKNFSQTEECARLLSGTKK